MKKAIILFLYLLFCAVTLWGQSPGGTGFIYDPTDTTKKDTLTFDIDINIAEQLYPIDSIIEIAYINSPSLKFYSSMIDVRVQNYKYTRVLFFQGISAFYNYSIGDQQIIVAGTTPVDNTQFANGYRYGFNVQIPLSTFLGQRPRNKQLRAEIDAAKWRKEEIKLEIKREVQRLYINMMEGQRKLNVRTEDAQIALMAARVAEEELAEGRIPPSEYSRIRNIYAIALSNVELERGNFLRAFYDLEALVGVEMRFLKKPVVKKQPTPAIPPKKK